MIGAVQVTTTLYPGVIRNYLGNVSHAALRRAGAATVKRARTEIVKHNLIRTGEMYRSVQASNPYQTRAGLWVVEVSAPTDHTDYMRSGSGPIYPVRAKMLRFKPKGSTQYVFARRTRGYDRVDFLATAAKAVRLSDFIDPTAPSVE